MMRVTLTVTKVMLATTTVMRIAIQRVTMTTRGTIQRMTRAVLKLKMSMIVTTTLIAMKGVIRTVNAKMDQMTTAMLQVMLEVTPKMLTNRNRLKNLL